MAPPSTRRIDLPADIAELVDAQISSGAYATDDAVLRDAMRALEQRRKLRVLQEMVEASVNDPRPGLTADELREELRLRAESYAHQDHA